MPRPIATLPLLVPPDLRERSVRVLLGLAMARLVPVASLRSFAGRQGLDPGLVDLWITAGLIAAREVVTDAVTGATAAVAALTPAGARELAAVSTTNVPPTAAARLRRSGPKLAHDAGVGDLALTFMAADDAGVLELDAVSTDDTLLATSAVLPGPKGVTRVPLKADAYALLRVGQAPSALLIEFDRSTISTKRMAAKFAAYAAWRKTDGPSATFAVRALRLLTVVPDVRRLRRLHDAAFEATGGKRSGFFLFALASAFRVHEPEHLHDPIVRQLGDEGCVPLISPAPAPPAAPPRSGPRSPPG